MSYGNWNARSPEEVQRQNGRATDFNAVAKRYEEIKPLRGKRSTLDVRPWGDRDRAWERVVKVSDDEYFLSCSSYAFHDNQKLGNQPQDAGEVQERRAMTFKRDENVETIILHKPRWGWASPSVYYFYNYNLPISMGMEKHRGTTYVKVKKPDTEYAYNYYTMDKGDVVFIKPIQETRWLPFQVYSETKHSLNRKKTKAIRQELEDFMSYAKSMLPFVEAKYQWGAIIGNDWRLQLKREDKDTYPEDWLTTLSRFAGKCKRYDWKTRTEYFNEKTVMQNIYREVYKQEKPFDVHEVELGQLSYDSYRGWL